MIAMLIRLLSMGLATIVLGFLGGCSGAGTKGGPGYDINPFAYGTDQFITPTNDQDYWDGEPMDYRSSDR
jgi:hypothetical protein